MSRVVVAGAGPAGLAVAHGMGHRDVLLLEGAEEAGGLCRSFNVGGCTFDYGGHAFFTKHAHVAELLTQGTAVFRQPRSAWVRSHDRFIPYPFQAHLHDLPDDVVEECVIGIVRAARGRHTDPARSFGEWIPAKFGEGIARHFMTPYNQKLWAHPLADMAPMWTAERVVQPDVMEVVSGAVTRRSFADFPNAEVCYPASGGFFELYRPFVPSGPELRLGNPVVEVDLRSHRVSTPHETLAFEHLVSTMPIPHLVAMTPGLPDEVRAAAKRLMYNSLCLVSLAVAAPDRTRMQRVYCADPAVPFHKLVLNSNSSPSLANTDNFGIQAEVSYSASKPIGAGDPTESVVQSLIDMSLLDSARDVVASDVRAIEFAYPIQTAQTPHLVEAIAGYYARHDVHLVGRFGRWRYVNSDGAFAAGLALGTELSAHG